MPWLNQGCCKIGKTTRAGRSAEGDSHLPEREVSSLHPSFPPPQAAKREFATALTVDKKNLESFWVCMLP
jgi:hypothetical protein